MILDGCLVTTGRVAQGRKPRRSRVGHGDRMRDGELGQVTSEGEVLLPGSWGWAGSIELDG